jgi:hypothetical protein
MVMKERVSQLEEKEDPNLRLANLIGYETVQADHVGGNQSQGENSASRC